MGLVSYYREWSLFHQVQILFISVSLLICGILILITKYQLDWIRSEVITGASGAFRSRLYFQLESIAYLESSYLESELTTYEDFTLNLALTDELINGFNKNYSSQVFEPSEPHSHTSTSSMNKYSSGVYYSKFSQLSAQGAELVKNESILNNIYPYIYESKYQSYYQGYYTDQILNIYPAYEFTSAYSPLSREWFYRGAHNGHNLTFTEPYGDAATGQWIMSVSRGVMNSSKVFGVAACDISLDSLLQKVSKIKVLDHGFGVLVSATGIVLTVPEQWVTGSDDILRIFDTVVTSISVDSWFEIRDSPDEQWINAKVEDDEEAGIVAADYKIYKKNIIPGYQSNVTHYFLIIVNRNELDDVENNLEDNFENTYQTIFIVIYSISIVVVVVVFLFCYYFGKVYAGKFVEVERVLGEVLRKGFFTKVVKQGCTIWKDCEMYSGFESFKQAVYSKVDYIEKKELDAENYYFYDTRPNDNLWFDEWMVQVYPQRSEGSKPGIWDSQVNKIMSKIKDL